MATKAIAKNATKKIDLIASKTKRVELMSLTYNFIGKDLDIEDVGSFLREHMAKGEKLRVDLSSNKAILSAHSNSWCCLYLTDTEGV